MRAKKPMTALRERDPTGESPSSLTRPFFPTPTISFIRFLFLLLLSLHSLSLSHIFFLFCSASSRLLRPSRGLFVAALLSLSSRHRRAPLTRFSATYNLPSSQERRSDWSIDLIFRHFPFEFSGVSEQSGRQQSQGRICGRILKPEQGR